MSAEADPPDGVDPQSDPGPPTEPIGISPDSRDVNFTLQAGEVVELLGRPERLQPSLPRQTHVLEVAAATIPRTGVGTRGGDAVGRGSQDLHRIGSQK